jgi:hypothetical protein
MAIEPQTVIVLPNNWLYLIQDFEPMSVDELEQRLNDLGADGWELLSLTAPAPGVNRGWFKKQR